MSTTTVQLLCMTCCERLSATDEVGGEEASQALDEMAKRAGWVRIERRPKHPADVCDECARLIWEAWERLIQERIDAMKMASYERMNRETVLTDEEQRAVAMVIRSTAKKESNG